MRRPVSWFERNDDGVKREVSVTIEKNSVRFDVRLSTESLWRRGVNPTPADWDTLLQKVENWYRRRNATHEALELVRRLKPKTEE